MEVPVSALRAELKSWIERARDGEEVVITERGVPVARLTGVATADLVTELVRDGVLVPPAGSVPCTRCPRRRSSRRRTGRALPGRTGRVPPTAPGPPAAAGSRRSCAGSGAEGPAVALVYFDASALVKLCVPEAGSALASRLWNRADVVVTSRLADVEVRAALAAGPAAG